MSNEHSKIFNLIVQKLKNIKFEQVIKGEPHLQKELWPKIQQVLNENYLSEYVLRTQSSKQNPKKAKCPKIDMLGRSYWPDIAILKDKEPIIGIELKVSNKETEIEFKTSKLTNAIKVAVGQCIIYKVNYKYCIAYIKTNYEGERSIGKKTSKTNDEKFRKILSDNKVELIITSGK